jgi:hypothetical protein
LRVVLRAVVFLAVDFFATLFLGAALRVVLRAVVFLAVVFFTGRFLAAVFLAAVLRTVFGAVLLFAVVLRVEAFFAVDARFFVRRLLEELSFRSETLNMACLLIYKYSIAYLRYRHGDRETLEKK